MFLVHSHSLIFFLQNFSLVQEELIKKGGEFKENAKNISVFEMSVVEYSKCLCVFNPFFKDLFREETEECINCKEEVWLTCFFI